MPGKQLACLFMTAALVATCDMGVNAAMALDASTTKQLEALAPSERLEQRCDMEAMNRISKDRHEFRPDKVIAYTFSSTKSDGNHLRAPGAVFRSKGQWYRLKYSCDGARDNLDVKNFTYQIGPEVPKESWKQYYLYE